MYKVIQWATGAMGRASLRRIIEHPDLELAGLFVYGNKAGQDAGDLVRRPKTGIIATNKIEDILALDADVVMHMPRLTRPYDAMNGDVEKLLASGKNVISIAGFHWPDAQGPAYAAPLHAACIKGQSSLAGLGLNPGTLAERIMLAATGMSTRLDRINVSEAVDASNMASPEFVFDLMGFGSDPAVVDLARGPLAALYTVLFSEVFFNVAAALGTTIARKREDHRITTTPRDLTMAAGTIPAGRVAATEWRWVAQFENGIEMTLSILWTADPSLHGQRCHDHWVIELSGRPNIRLTMDISDELPDGPASRGLVDATVAVALAGIPAVCAAPPGFFAYAPPPVYSARLGNQGMKPLVRAT